MKFSLGEIEKSASQTFDVIVGHYDDEAKTPVGFRVVGTGSEQYAQADRNIQILNIKEAALRTSGKLDLTTDKDAGLIADGAEKRRVLQTESCVVDWFGFTEDDGVTPLEFNSENLRRMLKARPHWANLILLGIEDERNFMKG
ncbi:MAG: hypothetical protein ACOYBW_08680 [Fluviibacter phosphoraccumulans]